MEILYNDSKPECAWRMSSVAVGGIVEVMEDLGRWNQDKPFPGRSVLTNHEEAVDEFLDRIDGALKS
jgi:hypothetical protein